VDYGKARWSLLRLDHRPAGRGWGCGGDISVKRKHSFSKQLISNKLLPIFFISRLPIDVGRGPHSKGRCLGATR
jgi:hypothetical protein